MTSTYFSDLRSHGDIQEGATRACERFGGKDWLGQLHFYMRATAF